MELAQPLDMSVLLPPAPAEIMPPASSAGTMVNALVNPQALVPGQEDGQGLDYPLSPAFDELFMALLPAPAAPVQSDALSQPLLLAQSLPLLAGERPLDSTVMAETEALSPWPGTAVTAPLQPVEPTVVLSDSPPPLPLLSTFEALSSIPPALVSVVMSEQTGAMVTGDNPTLTTVPKPVDSAQSAGLSPWSDPERTVQVSTASLRSAPAESVAQTQGLAPAAMVSAAPVSGEDLALQKPAYPLAEALASPLPVRELGPDKPPVSVPGEPGITLEPPVLERQSDKVAGSSSLDMRLKDFQNFPAAMGERLAWLVNKEQRLAQIRLDPPELGRLQIALSIDGDQVSVQFQASGTAVKDLILQQVDRLRQAMASHDLNLVNVNVSTGGDGRSTRQHPLVPELASVSSALVDDNQNDSPVAGELSGRLGSGLLDTFA